MIDFKNAWRGKLSDNPEIRQNVRKSASDVKYIFLVLFTNFWFETSFYSMIFSHIQSSKRRNEVPSFGLILTIV